MLAVRFDRHTSNSDSFSVAPSAITPCPSTITVKTPEILELSSTGPPPDKGEDHTSPSEEILDLKTCEYCDQTFYTYGLLK